MESVLFRMQEISQNYVEILREILGIDVSILDDRLFRVAGSGRMKERTGSMVHYGRIMQHAIDTGDTVVVTDPVDNVLCDECPSRDRCDNLCDMWTPIILEKRPVGVIGCVCYDESQKALFMERQGVFRQFFVQFASLLASQAASVISKDRSQNIRNVLEQVLGRVQIGVIIMD